jgi:hypothetical protein
MAYWWVNQNRTWRHEIFGEYLWAPQVGADGRGRVFWSNMTLLAPGDVVFSHFDGALRYAGVVVNEAVTDRKPDFGFAGSSWDDIGWSVEMRYVELHSVVQPKNHLDFYNQVAPEKYAPMTSFGRVNQQYLFALPLELGEFYLRLGGLTDVDVAAVVRVDPSVERLISDAEEVLHSPELTTTERHVLARARLGQGIFKEAVRQIEPMCRLTGLADPRHLIASHMKPWSKSDNAERLDGHNGLLLSPHVDNLFDRGLITFAKTGRVMVSPNLNPEVSIRWKLDFNQPGIHFNKGQVPYLEYHQDLIFQS